MKIKPSKEQFQIEGAIIMLVDCVKECCNNDKPLILHSMRVGFKLLEINEPKEVVIAGFLHDLLEDTNCKPEEIKRKFGRKVLDLVLSCTIPNTEDNEERWFNFVDQVKKAGEKAMIIKIIDADDNLSFVPLIKNIDYLKRILWKHEIIIKKLGANSQIKNLKIFKDYCNKYKGISKNYERKDKIGKNKN